MTTKRTSTDQVLAALQGPAISLPARSPAQQSNRPKAGHVRFTFDIDRSQHLFIRHFALDTRTTASAATRALWALVEEDNALAERVRGLLAARQSEVQ